MAVLDSLKVDSAPAAFAPTAQAHNALVDLITNMVGSNGVKVTVSEGRILIELSGTPGPGNSGDTGTPFNNELHYNSGGMVIDIDGGGINMATAGLNIQANADFVGVTTADGDQVAIQSDGFSVYASGSGKSLNIPFALLTHDMGIKTIDYCDDDLGACKIDIVASDPYVP